MKRVAIALWLVLAFCVWNVIFDRVLVLAGRRYVYAAAVAASESNTYLRIDDWMRPAIARGFWEATAAGAAIVVIGIVGVVLAGNATLKGSRHNTRPGATSSESLQKN